MVEVLAIVFFVLIFGIAVMRKKKKQNRNQIGKSSGYRGSRSRGVEHDNDQGNGSDGSDSGGGDS